MSNVKSENIGKLTMTLKDVLTGLVAQKEELQLSSAEGSFTPADLMNSLSETKLKTEAYYQPGLYIAEINESGYLGAVLFKVKTT